MKSMTWKPDEEHDKKTNDYLDRINHAPYLVIGSIILGLFCLLTLIILIGVF